MIIIYHLDEKSSIPFGQLLFEKGYNNIYLLTGGYFKILGIEDFLKDYRDLVEGKDIPIIKKTGKFVILE
jgi:hypothetical protein